MIRTSFALLLAGFCHAQQIDLTALDRLAEKAKESSLVDLDADKIKLASKFLSDDKVPQGLISGMKAIFVRSFEFDKGGAYALSDLEPIRRQLKQPGWSRVVEVKDDDEISEVHLFSKNGSLEGLAVIAAESRELTVVNIVGPVNLASLAAIAGKLGVPNLRLHDGKPPAPADKRKEEE